MLEAKAHCLSKPALDLQAERWYLWHTAKRTDLLYLSDRGARRRQLQYCYKRSGPAPEGASKRSQGKRLRQWLSDQDLLLELEEELELLLRRPRRPRERLRLRDWLLLLRDELRFLSLGLRLSECTSPLR